MATFRFLSRFALPRSSAVREGGCLSRVLVKHLSSHQPMSNMEEQQANIDMLKKVFDLVVSEGLMSGNFDRSKKVVEFVHPQDLAKCLGGLDITPEGLDDVQGLLEAVVKYSVKTCHPHFFNQLYHGSEPSSLAGQWLSDALNTNNHTFEVAPVFIVVERALIEYTIKKIGWDRGDGITAPGGSLANMYGLMLARHEKMPSVKEEGLVAIGAPFVVYTSEDSHYSVLKAANWMGIGTNNVVKVKSDHYGRMIPEELSRAIQQSVDDGKVPMAVMATAGTTVLGAFDDFAQIGDICKNFNVWLHVDACWGGSVLVSSKLKHLMAGIEKADSVAWNFHKCLGAPLQSNIFVTNRQGLLASCNAASASYLFQPDKFYDISYDTGDKSVQCGRKVDAFQVWFMFKARGESYFAAAVENAFAQSDFLADLIRKREGFELVVDPHSCTNVCFNYIPPSLRGRVRDEQFYKDLSSVPPKIKERLVKKGSLLIGYQAMQHKKLVNFFRMVVHAFPQPTNEDMLHVLDEIELCGTDL